MYYTTRFDPIAVSGPMDSVSGSIDAFNLGDRGIIRSIVH